MFGVGTNFSLNKERNVANKLMITVTKRKKQKNITGVILLKKWFSTFSAQRIFKMFK
jgi:hypothetical protein